jgi:hypothetical protein
MCYGNNAACTDVGQCWAEAADGNMTLCMQAAPRHQCVCLSSALFNDTGDGSLYIRR